MVHMQERQLLLSSLFKKSVQNAIRHSSCYYGKKVIISDFF